MKNNYKKSTEEQEQSLTDKTNIFQHTKFPVIIQFSGPPLGTMIPLLTSCLSPLHSRKMAVYDARDTPSSPGMNPMEVSPGMRPPMKGHLSMIPGL